jgi:hypothetical protein
MALTRREMLETTFFFFFETFSKLPDCKNFNVGIRVGDHKKKRLTEEAI